MQGVRVKRATGLNKVDETSDSDPYFLARIGSNGSTWKEKLRKSEIPEFKSKTIDDDNNPTWDAEFGFMPSEGLEITLMIYDKNKGHSRVLKVDTFLGEATIQIPKGGSSEEMEYTLTGKGCKGTVTVEFFVSEGPLEPRNCKQR